MMLSAYLKRVFSVTCALIFTFVFFATPMSKPEKVNAAFRSEYEQVCETAYMLSMDTGKVIYEKDGDKRMLPASLT
ncbi:MAG: hypothetical protein IIZ08_02930, partial [Clostridia bacterium]|nr:hypothetical protein [Clostridia bacterium]